MIDVIRRFLTLGFKYATPLTRQRAGGLFMMNLLLFVGWLIYVVYAVIPMLVNGVGFEPVKLLAVGVVPFLNFAIHRSLQTGRLKTASWLFVIVLGAAVLPFIDFDRFYTLPIALTIPMVAAGVVLDRRSFGVVLFVLLVVLVARVGAASQQSTTNIFDEAIGYEIILAFCAVSLSAVFLYVFSGSAQRISVISEDDIQHLRAVSAFVESEDEDALLATTLRTIQNELGYSLAQVFLVGDDGSIQRRNRLGIGMNELTSTTLVNAGDTAVIQDVVANRKTLLITESDAQPRRSHLIASAHYALAVPMVSEDRVLGVLDIQTNANQPFSDNQIEAFRLLGQRLGEGLYRARLLGDLRRSLREREEAAAFMRAQFSEMQRRDRQMVVSGWNTYLQSRGQLFGYDLQNQNGNLVPAADLPPEIRAALERGDVFVEPREGEQIINAPIVFRGEVLGAMSFAVPADRPVSERDLEMVRTVANRLGVALENNRLLEQTQAQAQRERKASEVANVLLTATSIETLIELAADNFNEALDAIYTRIYLEPGVVAEPPATRGEPV
ncbi:MAG TPA: GAF domain-containing protein [Oceanobacillus sp.]|nr:GAF domain-containing protein [Oceanobacillus sp.]